MKPNRRVENSYVHRKFSSTWEIPSFMSLLSDVVRDVAWILRNMWLNTNLSWSCYLVREPAGEDGVPGELAHVAGGELPDLEWNTRFDIT